MGIAPSCEGSSVANQGGATITCKIEPFLSPVSDIPVIVPHLKAAPAVPQVLQITFDELLKYNYCQKKFASCWVKIN